jgi:sortase (surface protein transpeptidase)
MSLQLAVGVGLASGCLAGANPSSRSSSPAPVAVGGPVVPSSEPRPLPTAAAEAPARLAIPQLGVDAQVEPVGVDAQGRLGTPSRPENVGWYRLGAAPGQPGDAVIDGHLDWVSGPAVFWRLHQLRIGDEATVTGASGGRLRFVVDSVSSVAYDANVDSLFVTSGPPSLTLLTCTGAWDRQRATYLQRLVVHLSLPPAPPSEKPGEAG